MELERELQAERSAREQEVAELAVKIAELTRTNAELRESSKSDENKLVAALKDIESVRQDKNNLTKEAATLRDDLAQAEKAVSATKAAIYDSDLRLKAAESESLSHISEKDAMRSELALVKAAQKSYEADLGDLEIKHARLEDRRRELLEALGERERTLRDHRSEADLDHATLEKEILEEKERSALQIKEVENRLLSTKADLEQMKIDLSMKEDELAELQVMCNERGKAVEEAHLQSQGNASQIRLLLNHVKLFYDPLAAFLASFIDERIPLAPTTSLPGKEGTLSTPSGYHPLQLNVTSLEAAIATLGKMDSTLVELAKEKMTSCAKQTKKWQKECKRYRDRAEKAIFASKEKIAFRRLSPSQLRLLTSSANNLAMFSFARNDLALFLPTRNSTLQVFAAFNYVSKPILSLGLPLSESYRVVQTIFSRQQD